MGEQNNGGPAFPVGKFNRGMSLRDWFAGQALAGIAGNMRPQREQAINNGEAEADWEASLAFHIADAMLAASQGSHP